jgi:putative acetyltransferase
MLRIVEGNLDDARVVRLLETHIGQARAQTAEGSAHALDLDALRDPQIRFWSIWKDEELLGVGALKRLARDHGEVKSMHTAQTVRGSGVASFLMRHIIETAREERMAALSLETGSWDYFAPARAFYRKHGFTECPPFGDYRADPNSAFFSLKL